MQKIRTMIKVGDKVKFLNDVGGGIVTSFIGNNMVNVENEDGFEIPYPIHQLVNVDAPEMVEKVTSKPETVFPQQEEVIPMTKEGEIINGKNDPEFYFCLVPQNPGQPVSDAIHFYLVNDSNFTLQYRYAHQTADRISTVKYGSVQSHGRVLLETIGESDLNELPDFAFQILYFRDEEDQLHQSITKSFRLNPVKFYKTTSFLSNKYFTKNAIVLKIANKISDLELDKMTQGDFKQLVKEKEAKPQEKKVKRQRTPEIVEVDLHINELLDQPEGLSNREILGIQMDKVESEMNAAIQGGVQKIVFIHGVGQGVLKQEVANLLKRKFKKYYFQDASFKEYGYGATMVTLRRK